MRALAAAGLVLVSGMGTGAAAAQTGAAASPFLFASLAPAPGGRVVTSFDAGYNERAFEPVAGERFEPRLGLMAPLSPLLAVAAHVGFADAPDGRGRAAEQGELWVTPVRRGGHSLTGGVGVRHEYGGTTVALARLAGARATARSAVAADVLLERPHAAGRDALDVITTVGFAHAVAPGVWLGVEAVGSDLEGFWEQEEAEGGATLLLGPTLAVSPSARWRLVVGGGPVVRATRSTALAAVGDKGAERATGYVLRTSVRAAW
jgi:hypothetical protein